MCCGRCCQVRYSVRSERMLMEQLEFNLLFRWFVGVGIGRRRMGADDLHEESGSAARRRHRAGLLRVNWQFLFGAAAYNLVRMRTLETTA
jgi:hypothetical protein